MSIAIDGKWHGYYCAFVNGQGSVYCRTSDDLRNWSEPKTVALGGRAGVGPYSAECPHVVERDGIYYLFRTQRYGGHAQTSVYASTDPTDFGVNQDARHYVGRLPVAAPEIVMRHEGQDYIAALTPDLQGIRVAKLSWSERPGVGEPVFDFDSAEHRNRWRVTSGESPVVFTQTYRAHFNRPTGWMVATSEGARDTVDDRRRCVVESPPFVVDRPWHFVAISGGDKPDLLYVELVDEKSGGIHARVSPQSESDWMNMMLVDTSDAIGREVRVRVVDKATGAWGRVAFGGVFRGEPR